MSGCESIKLKSRGYVEIVEGVIRLSCEGGGGDVSMDGVVDRRHARPQSSASTGPSLSDVQIQHTSRVATCVDAA